MSAISATRSSAAGPSPPRFGNAEDVHVVAFDLDAEPASVLLLSEDERLRAERFHFERDRRRFVAARSVLRRSLARYLGADPAELVFEYGAHGKPSLPGSGVTFNVSHSGRAALVAFAPGFDVGVDLELLAHGRPDDHRVADRFFSPYEVSTLASYPAAERSGAFLRCWTRKEAFVKAHGDGLSLSLQDFDVAFGAGEACGLLRTAWSSVEPAEWTLLDISELAVEGVAALAARTPGARVVRMPRNELLERKGART
jgi:4'-phosphopantetheinyl transferase